MTTAAQSQISTYLLQLAPQRSTQYSDLVATLAPVEFALSEVARTEGAAGALVELCSQRYLRFRTAAPLDGHALQELRGLATVDGLFELFDRIGDQPGPFLRPIDISPRLRFAPALAMSRRYRGKTNELFTHFLCNLARQCSDLRTRAWDSLRILDPLAGGGTTLLTGLMLGADVAGIEAREQDVSSTVAFLRQFAREEGIACRVQQSRLKKLGKRWVLSLGKEPPSKAVLACGDTADAVALLDGFKPHLVVTDLPYGIQHQGQLQTLLRNGLPVWASLLPPSGALVFAWDATRFPRQEMVALVESVAPLRVCSGAPYDQLAHRVDRIIQRRDVLAARRA